MTHWGGQAWRGLIGIPTNGGWWTLHNQLIWTWLIVFVIVAGWFDLRERRVPNAVNFVGLLVLFILQVLFQSGWSASFALVVTALWMLVPTLLGIWGQGDWKMSMACGVAIGVLPMLLIWFGAFLLAIPLRRLTHRASLTWLDDGRAKSVPVASFVAVAACSGYVLACLFA